MAGKKEVIKTEEEPYHTPFDYINKDLDFLFIFIFLEAYKEKRDLLNFAGFFKGNYWDVDDIKSEVTDTQDYYSIPDMVLEQATFLFEDLRLGKIIEVGIDDTSETLKDLLIEVAKIGAERADEEAPYFTEAVEQICFLEQQEHNKRFAEAEKNPSAEIDLVRFRDKSVFFPNDEYHGYFRAMQPIVIHLPNHILIRVTYDSDAVARIEQEISSYLERFSKDELLSELPRYQPKRLYFAKQIENFYRYISKQNLIGNTINIPFTILTERDFEAVKILTYLQLKGIIQMHWSDEGSWKVQFDRLPITPNSLLGSNEVSSTPEVQDFSKANLSFDEVKSILSVGNKTVRIQKGRDQFHLLRIMFTDPKEVGKEWFYSEIAEKNDFAAQTDDKKFYNAAYQVKHKIKRDTGLPDVLSTTTQSVRINPKYLRQN